MITLLTSNAIQLHYNLFSLSVFSCDLPRCCIPDILQSVYQTVTAMTRIALALFTVFLASTVDEYLKECIEWTNVEFSIWEVSRSMMSQVGKLLSFSNNTENGFRVCVTNWWIKHIWKSGLPPCFIIIIIIWRSKIFIKHTIVHWRRKLHTRLSVPSSTPESTTVRLLAAGPKYLHEKLQCVLRAAARLVLQLPHRASVSDIMRRQLHWLEMPDRIRFKLCTLVFRCLHGLAPRYLSDLCTPATVHTHLRSSVTLERSLLVPRTKTKTIGPRGFYFASSAAWNALPVHLRDPGLSLNNFKIKLKTHFFSWSPHLGIMFSVFVARANVINL